MKRSLRVILICLIGGLVIPLISLGFGPSGKKGRKVHYPTGYYSEKDAVSCMDNIGIQEIKNVPMPNTIYFCGEKVPLNLYYVREAMEREIVVNSYLHGSTILNLKRANKVFPIIEPILKRNGIPEDMKYLAVAESNLLNVVSPAGATGVWQFMKETAKRYGLEVSQHVDERYHLERATEAACVYLKESYEKFGTWTTAAASYNSGVNGMLREVRRQGDSIYYNMNLNTETGRYIYRIIALKLIFENPIRYGFYLKKSELYPVIPTKTLVIDTTINDLVAFAQSQRLNYKILVEFNPWIISYSLPMGKHRASYSIVIPKEGYYDYEQRLETPSDTTWLGSYR